MVHLHWSFRKAAISLKLGGSPLRAILFGLEGHYVGVRNSKDPWALGTRIATLRAKGLILILDINPGCTLHRLDSRKGAALAVCVLRIAAKQHHPPIPRATATRPMPRERPWVLYATLIHTPRIPASSLESPEVQYPESPAIANTLFPLEVRESGIKY